MSLNGFIKTHRKIMEWEWYKNQNVKDVFLHLCLKANFKENNFEGVQIKPGQFVTSQSHLAEELGLSRQKIRTALKNLERTGEITMEPTNKFTMITLVNWGKYQIQDLELTNNPTSEQPTVNQQPTSEQPQLNNDNNLIMEERKKDSQTAPSFSSSTSEPIPRSVEEVQQYCERMGYKIDAARFFYYYSGHGWKTGNEPIMDWHALVKHWNETQREFNEPVQEQPKQAEAETKENDLSYELWAAYSDLSEEGEIKNNPILPISQEEILGFCAVCFGYSKYAYVDEFYQYFNDNGWKVSGWIIRDWKLLFQIWVRLKEQNLNNKEIVIRMYQSRFSSLDSMFFCTEEERNKVKEKLDWRVKAAR